MTMMGILQVASYIYKRYMDDFGVRIDEMKLHKLLYFTQRECLIQKGEPMFEALFEAWKYGPVLVNVRSEYLTGHMFDGEYEELSDTEKELVDSFPELMDKEQVVQYEPVLDMVFKTYAPQKSWSLSTLTHGEYSWKHAREGYDELDSCEVEMKTEDIMVDANRVRERRAVLRQLNLYNA